MGLVPPQRHNDLTCGVCEVYPRAFIKTASNIDKAVDTHSLQALNIDLYCPAVSISLLMMSSASIKRWWPVKLVFMITLFVNIKFWQTAYDTMLLTFYPENNHENPHYIEYEDSISSLPQSEGNNTNLAPLEKKTRQPKIQPHTVVEPGSVLQEHPDEEEDTDANSNADAGDWISISDISATDKNFASDWADLVYGTGT